MQALRWILALIAAIIAYIAGFLGMFLLTRQMLGSASAGHFGAMMAACLLAVYVGGAAAPGQDRKLAATIFAALAVALPALILAVGFLENRPVTHGVEELMGALIGAALGVKVTSSSPKTQFSRY